MTTIKLKDTGVKTAAGTSCQLWRRQMLNGGICSYIYEHCQEHPLEFRAKIHAVML